MEHSGATEGPFGPAPADPRGDEPQAASTGSRAELVALLRLTRLDEDIARMLGALREIVGRLERERTDLAAFADLVSVDRGAIGRGPGELEEAPKRQERLRHNQKAYTAQVRAFERDQREALQLSAEIQRRMVEAGERRQALLTSVPRESRHRYETAARDGIRPALVPEEGGRCPACGARLGGSRRLVSAEGRVVGCPGCPRLLYDPAGIEQDFRAPALRPLPKARP